jgi:hypothetical protein
MMSQAIHASTLNEMRPINKYIRDGLRLLDLLLFYKSELNRICEGTAGYS